MQTFFIFYHGFNHVVFHVIVARPGWSGEVIVDGLVFFVMW